MFWLAQGKEKMMDRFWKFCLAPGINRPPLTNSYAYQEQLQSSINTRHSFTYCHDDDLCILFVLVQLMHNNSFDNDVFNKSALIELDIF
jgi:hypothetical protein